MGAQNTEVAALQAALAQQQFSGGPLSEEEANATFATRAASTPTAVRALLHKLDQNVDHACATILGDSTGYDNTGWWYTLMGWLLDQYPSRHGTLRRWNATVQGYDMPLLAQTGPDGPRRYVSTGAGSDRFFTVPSPTSWASPDLDVRFDVKLPSLTPASNYALGGQFGASSNRRWFLELTTTGHLKFYWSDIGTGSLNKQATAVTPGGLVGQRAWLRATLDVDNGASGHDVKFYYSTDQGFTWTQIGATVTTAGTTTTFSSTDPVQMSGRSGAAVAALPGLEYYGMRVHDGIDGPAVVDIDFGPYNGFGSTFPEFTGKTVTWAGTTGSFVGSPTLSLVNGSASGQNVTYHSDATRFPKLTPMKADLVFVNHSHNAANDTDYRPDIKALTDLLVAKWPDAGLVLVAQNKRKSPAINITEHAIRVGQVVSFALGQGWPILDSWHALGDTPAYLNADGIHPTQAGYDALVEAAKPLFEAWLSPSA